MEINKFYKTTMTPNKFICYLKCVLIFASHNPPDSQSCAQKIIRMRSTVVALISER